MKLIEYISNVLFWIVTGWVITSSFSIQGQEIEIINGAETIRTVRDPNMASQLLVYVAVSLVMFYTNIFNINQLNRKSSNLKVFILSLLIFLAAIVIFYSVEQIFFSQYYSLPKQISIGITIFYFTISSAYGIIKIWILSEQRQKDLALVAKQAELNLLRNQLQPHFLFNALNNLLSLVDQEKSPKLASSFEELSHLLRYVIEEAKSEKVSISKEIDFIKNYCELQLLRFEEKEVTLEFKTIGENKNQLIEPGLFIPFVENAFKYGTEPEVNSSIKITFNLTDENEAIFQVQNKILPVLRKNDSTGTGIMSIRERLNIVYPDKHQLIISEDENFIVNLKIETN